ncbi:MAG: ABC transporter substrate-binding protein [Bellilinea sp.]|nr:MAG: ABC transporter substrate-binding protein [Bellilinea sp.]
MKTYQKLLNVLFVVVLALSLAACATPAATTPPPQPTTPPQPTQAEQPTSPPEPTAPPEPTTAPEPVTLRYANWNLGTEEENNIQRQLIKAYTDANPHVTIEFVDMSAEGGWEANLTNYAAKGQLPDVFMANNVPLYVKNGWLADLTPLVSQDTDWQKVPQVMKDAVTYNGQVLGLPAAQFIMGYFVNKELYDAANLDAPEYGVSPDEFFETAKALTNIPQGILGLDELEFVLGWYPSTLDSNLKWFSFDGEKMNYNSPAFKAAIEKLIELKPYTWQGLTDEQKANFKSVGPWELFLNQEVGVRWDASWNVPNYVQNATFDWDFIGIPGGNQALVLDIIVVSKTASNLEEAYKFAKWMTFSTEAYAKEAELARAMGSAPKLPVAMDEASLELYQSFVDKPGVNAALQNLDNSLIESLAKIIPGYINARWEGKPGIDIGEDKDVNMWYMFNFAADGRFKYEDYAAKLEEFANKILADARAELGQ